MPSINIQVTAGYSSSQKTALLKQATQAATEALTAPLATIRMVLQEVSADHTIIAGEIGKSMALFNVEMIAGRTEQQKTALIAALAKAAGASIGISDQDVRVIIRDVPNTDMGMAGGISAKATGR